MVKLNIDLPEEFFEEEVRCGYTVTREMKKIWAVDLDLLAEFDRVCKKYNLRYSLEGGSLLGAIRHHGMIPWDDDCDVTMLREDYEILKKVGPEEFKHPYFFQNAYTDKEYFKGHAQLRNSETTGILKNEIMEKRPYNQGIFLDIFVLDGFGTPEQRASQLERKNKYYHMYERFAYTYSKNTLKHIYRIIKSKIIKSYYYLKGWTVEKMFAEYEKICMECNAESEYVDKTMFRFKTMDLHVELEKKIFDDMIEVDFETLKVPVPREYDKVLKIFFGEDYMIPQKVDSIHGAVGVIWDTDRCYKDYFLKVGKRND
ncbi:MAG: phosphorylcholine transferase LicD, partial [Wujia sp.]